MITIEDMRGPRTLETRLYDESLLNIIEEVVSEEIVDKPYSNSESSDAITSYMSMYSDALQLFGNQIVAIDQNLVLTLEIAVTIYEHRTLNKRST